MDISVPALARAVARLGGIGHVSDAMMPGLSDRVFHTDYEAQKLQRYRENVGNPDKTGITFDLTALAQATHDYIENVMNAKHGCGAIFLNVMEKLTMGNPRDTLRARLNAALDAGIEGITMGAGLHLSSLELMKDHPRFRDAMLGIIVSSTRALKLFLNRAGKAQRMPDYIIVEGPLAGGHLGFPLNWQDYSLREILADVLRLLEEQHLNIPVIAAGGIFTGADGVDFMEQGASGVQVATRFAVTQESGLPDAVKQEFFRANEEDVVVNTVSATGYPMRMLRNSPAINSGVRPSCEAQGYLLDLDGHCPYNTAYNREVAAGTQPLRVLDKICLCAQMKAHRVWTCGQNVFRLKDTTTRLPDGRYQLPTAEEVFHAYQYGTEAHAQRPTEARCAMG